MQEGYGKVVEEDEAVLYLTRNAIERKCEIQVRGDERNQDWDQDE